MKIVYASVSGEIQNDPDIEKECKSLYERNLIPEYTLQYMSLSEVDYSDSDVVFITLDEKPHDLFDSYKNIVAEAKNNPSVFICNLPEPDGDMLFSFIDENVTNIHSGLLEWIDFVENP